VFYDLVSAHSNPAILEIDKDVSPRMARHWKSDSDERGAVRRIALLHHNRATLGLTAEEMRLLERTYTNFHRAGAGLDEAAKKRRAEINERPGRARHLVQPPFCSATSRGTGSWSSGDDDRAGLPEAFIASAKAAAEGTWHGWQGDRDACRALPWSRS